jgi:hypothetical protein
MRSLFDLMGTTDQKEHINVVLFAGGGGADEGMQRAGKRQTNTGKGNA